MQNVIALTLSRRPEYTSRVLDALAQCHGIQDYEVFFSLDWNDAHVAECTKVLQLVRSWFYSPACLKLHSPRLGIDENKLYLGDMLFALPQVDFVVFLEDDILPARDFLQFMEWGNRTFRDNPSILSMCGYNRHLDLDESQLYATWKDKCFHAWGWGMWRDRWERMFGFGAAEYRAWAGDKVNGLFDHYLAQRARDEALCTVMPVLARAQNIGLANGEHSTPETYKQDHNPRGAWEFELAPETHEWALPK